MKRIAFAATLAFGLALAGSASAQIKFGVAGPRTCGRDDQQGTVAGNFILDKFKGKKIAFVHDKTTYGQGLADATRSTMTKGGMKEVLYEGVNKDDKDFSAVVSKIKASGADLVY